MEWNRKLDFETKYGILNLLKVAKSSKYELFLDPVTTWFKIAYQLKENWSLSNHVFGSIAAVFGRVKLNALFTPVCVNRICVD